MSIDEQVVRDQHAAIGIRQGVIPGERNQHPDAQWFGNAGLGLFVHWGISSVRGEGDLSWSMMYPSPGERRRYGAVRDAGSWPYVHARVFGRKLTISSLTAYDPDSWLAAAKRARCRYGVLTTRHHDGYALWPSAHGEFGTRTHMGGRDLVRPFVEACRKQGLKVGLYYSPPDWYFNRHHMSFRSGGKGALGLPDLGLRHEPVTLPVLDDCAQREWDERLMPMCAGRSRNC